jgi:hypothetical protein
MAALAAACTFGDVAAASSANSQLRHDSLDELSLA